MAVTRNLALPHGTWLILSTRSASISLPYVDGIRSPDAMMKTAEDVAKLVIESLTLAQHESSIPFKDEIQEDQYIRFAMHSPWVNAK
jgi:hypothetical protein